MGLLLLGCVIFGLLFELLFYGKSLGISYPIAVLAFYLLFFLYNREKLKSGSKLAWLLSIPVLLLSATYAVYTNMIFAVLNFLLIPVLLAAQTLLLTGSNLSPWNNVMFIFDIAVAMILKVTGYVVKPFQVAKELVGRKDTGEGKKYMGKILAGLVISLPLLLIIIGLLVSSDMVFDYHFRQLQHILRDFNIGEFIIRFILVAAISILTYSYIYSIGIKPKYNYANIRDGFNTKILDPVTAITLLTIVNIIYFLFTIVQFSYLFGGSANSLPAGLNYSEYARRGFFELVAVTFINLGILLSVVNILKPSGKGMVVAVKVLNTLLIFFTAVILASAHVRMSLYEDAYGYTYLRVLTHLFMGFLMLLIIATLIKVWYTKIRLLGYFIAISVICYTAINYLNIDAFIAAKNIERYHRKEEFDAHYLTTLSYEAIPQVIDVLDDLPAGDADILTQWLKNRLSSLESMDDWQSFNLSRNRAERMLKNLYEGSQNLNEGSPDSR